MPIRAPRRWPHAMRVGVAALALALAIGACSPAEGDPPPVAGGVTIDVGVTGLGRVSYAAGALQCSGDCSWSVPGNRAIALVAEPQGSHVFAGWGGACDVFSNPCQGTFAEGDRVTATFAPHALRLNLTGDGEGVFSILGGGVQATCDADCFVTMGMPLQVAITYAAQGSTGTVLGDWTGPCDPGTVQPGYCLVNVSGLTEIGKTWSRAVTAVDDAYAATSGQTLVVAAPGVLANDAYADGSTTELVTDAGDGTLVLASDGGFTYAPRPGFEGTDGFVYRVRDLQDQTATASVTITVVREVATGPAAVDDVYDASSGVTLTIGAPGVLANDRLGSSGDPIIAELVDDVTSGSLDLASNGGFVYTSALGFAGTDAFTYRAFDGTLRSEAATVTITVGAGVGIVEPPTDAVAEP
jgi:hypothetical protein